MQTENKLLDDLAQLASGAAGSLGDIKAEIESRSKEVVEALTAGMDLVTREEFDAVKTMAAETRGQVDKLENRVAELEAALVTRKPRKKSSTKAEKTKKS